MELWVGVDAAKTAAAQTYFQERSEELVAMGAELLTEGRVTGWAQCRERMLNLIKAKLPNLDPALVDPDSACIEEVTAGPKIASHTDSGMGKNVGTGHTSPKDADHAGPKEADHAGSKEAEDAGSKVAELIVSSDGDQGNM